MKTTDSSAPRSLHPVFRFLPLILCLLLLTALSLQVFSPFLGAAASKSKGITAEQLEAQLKAAKRPKSEKWKLSLLPVGLQKNPQVDYTIITEMTDAGRKLPEPSFDKPIFYFPHSIGQKDVGDAYGGTKEIKFEFLKKQLNNALASNGYRETTQDDPKVSQVLMFSWGMHNKIEPMPEMEEQTEDTGDSGDTGGDATVTDATIAGANMGSMTADDNEIINMLGRAKTIGGTKFANEFATALVQQMAWSGSPSYETPGPLRDFAERDPNTEALVYAIFNDCYFLIVFSFDFEALKRKERKLLWTTRISTVSQGISFEATLPIMITNGAYFFGRETEGIEIIRRRAYQGTSVEIGPAQVIDFDTKPTTTGTAKPATSGTAAPAATGTAAPASGNNKKK